MTKMKLAVCLALAASAGFAQAESVTTLDGTFTVIESVAPLGSGLTFLGGGNGLIGTAGSWPTFADTSANRAFAMQNADLVRIGAPRGYSQRLVFSMRWPLPSVLAPLQPASIRSESQRCTSFSIQPTARGPNGTGGGNVPDLTRA